MADSYLEFSEVLPRTCSKPCAGECGGGGLFVTAEAIRFVDAHDFVAACQGEFIACNAQPDAGNEKAEPSQVRRSTERRFVLYDFDAQELAATSVYDHPAEAADDASALANVIVLPIQVEGVGIGGTTEQLGRPDRGLIRQPEEPNDAYGLGW